MTTTYTLTGNLLDLIGGDVKAPVVWVGTNLGDLALIDLDNNETHPPGRVRLPLIDGVFSTDLIATNSAGINVPDGSLRYIVYVEYSSGSGGQKANWSSGFFTLTGNADLSDKANTNPGSLVDVDDVALAAVVSDAVALAAEAQMAGLELGYAERTTSFVSATSAVVTGLSVTVVGQGRPVDIECYIPRAYHATNGALIEVSVIMDGVTTIQSDATDSYNTATGRALNPRRRLVLTDGVSYTFTVSFSRDIGGNTTLYATAGRAMWLSVVSR